MAPEGLPENRWEQLRHKLGDPIPPQIEHIGSWQNVEFEMSRHVHRFDRCYFDASLDRLRRNGYSRHARPQEYFSARIPALQGNASADIGDLCHDLERCSTPGEWLSFALEMRGDQIILSTEPEGFVWSAEMHVPGRPLCFAERRAFTLPYHVTGRSLLLNKSHDDIVRYLCGVPFAQLPPQMNSDANGTYLLFPPEKIIQPVFVHFTDSGCFIDGTGQFSALSRGVREIRGGP